MYSIKLFLSNVDFMIITMHILALYQFLFITLKIFVKFYLYVGVVRLCFLISWKTVTHFLEHGSKHNLRCESGTRHNAHIWYKAWCFRRAKSLKDNVFLICESLMPLCVYDRSRQSAIVKYNLQCLVSWIQRSIEFNGYQKLRSRGKVGISLPKRSQ